MRPRLVPPTEHGVVVRVPAKVNVALSVGPPGDDGYHDVVTVLQALSLYDEVSVTPVAGGPVVEVVGTESAGVPVDDRNLAWRAAVAVADAVGVAPDVRITIDKAIPVAAGLAGGSADAAATLVACDALWGGGLDRSALDALAAELGSDVPFLLHGGTAVGTGRGERLTPALARGRFSWVLVASDRGLSAGAVYAELDRLRGGADVPPASADGAVMAALRTGDARALGTALSNDLQAAALSLRPGLAALLDLGLECGALGAVVSGSGPTCAFLAEGDEAAISLAVELSASGIARDIRRVHGPVGGARVVGADRG